MICPNCGEEIGPRERVVTLHKGERKNKDGPDERETYTVTVPSWGCRCSRKPAEATK
jgi:hypothetical protein